MPMKSQRYFSNEEQLLDFVENASLGLHCVAADGSIRWANLAEMSLLGYQEKEYIGEHIAKFHADEQTIKDILTRLSQNETLKNYPARLRCKDGSIKHVLINSSVYWENGEFIHTRCFTRDITEIKEKENELKQYAKELEKSNCELNAFAYVASHDLKEPLRGIKNYVQALLQEYSDSLVGEGQKHLQVIDKLTVRMDNLLDSLLYYSQVDKNNTETETVDLDQLLTVIVEDVKHFYVNDNVKITFSKPAPKVQCDLTRVNEIFYNLISNAVKYNANSVKEIEIGYYKKDDQGDISYSGEELSDYVFYVKDYGIGIDSQNFSLIFDIFRRLHAQDQYQGGCGVGLTIVKKIIEMYHGEIWLESTLGEGSTFYFSLGKAE